ncbi:hypothetical protein VHEMI02794 [[Torrubiella] hemipterigena]|uniref:Uncharacterized protein n=1 Tax=[Torrubiella] hemipterigena TaxID=1531966 RepID=A0A0A1SWT1_9HYPO|nr:hypothetical protein VHEMI02794 [[Torrubiella] hemipterigena]
MGYHTWDYMSLMCQERKEMLVGVYRPDSYQSLHDTRGNAFIKLVNMDEVKPKPAKTSRWKALRQLPKRRPRPNNQHQQPLSALESLPSELINCILDRVTHIGDIMSLGRTCPILARHVFARYASKSTVGSWSGLPLTCIPCDFTRRNNRHSSRQSYHGLPLTYRLPLQLENEPSGWDISIYDTSGREGDSRYLIAKYPWGTNRLAVRSSKTSDFEKALYTTQVPDFEARAGRRWLLRNHTKSLVVRLRLHQNQKKDAMPHVVVNGGTKLSLDILLMLCTINKGRRRREQDTTRWYGDCFDIVPDTRDMRRDLRESGWRDATELVLYSGRYTMRVAAAYRGICRSPLRQGLHMANMLQAVQAARPVTSSDGF